jgi:CxxC motif-containing protein (DUF1111 family)
MHDTTTVPVRPRPRWLPYGIALLAVALATLGWGYWKTRIAWKSGYGDGAMSAIAQADPRALSGGDMTTFHTGFMPFGQTPENLPWQYEAIFEEGDGIFDKPYLPGDGRRASEIKAGGGLRRVGVGPLFNATACAECHFRDGRVLHPYVSGGPMVGMFLRMSAPDGKGGWQAPPGYHAQLRDKSVEGVPPEGIGHIDWEEVPGRFPDGEAYSLRKPRYRVRDLAHGPLPEGTILEARTAPPVHGVGLLEAIDDATLLALAKAQEGDPDGVSGRVNRVVDPETGQTAIGRFSLKANVPSLRAQAAGAAFNDMGVTSPVHPRENCLPHQTACLQAKHGGTPEEPELPERFLQSLTVYLQLLAVPARRNLDDPVALRGEELFKTARCNACHVDTLKTGNTHEIPRLRNQTIHPYSDLLLHDMGPELAGRPDHEATAQEWRTPPLWGIGLTERSNRHTMFLHDQRARNLQEAILWHGGEAAAARSRFMAMAKADRQALLRFLESL